MKLSFGYLAPLLCLLAVCSGAAPAPTFPPVENFFAAPELSYARVSPDGHHLAFLTKLGTGHTGIAWLDVDRGGIEPLVVAKDEDIQMFFWKGNDYLVYGGELNGNESTALRSFRLKDRHVFQLAESVAEYGDVGRVMSSLPKDPYRILVHGRYVTNDDNIGILFLDIRNGERSKITGAFDPFTYNHEADNDGVVRSRDRFTGDKIVHEIRADGRSSFQIVGETPREIGIVSPAWKVMGFSADNQTAYVVVRGAGEDVGALYGYNTATRALGPELFRPSEGEIESVVFNHDHSVLRGVVYNSDRLHYQWFDAGRGQMQARLDASFPNATNTIVSASDDEKVLVIASSGDHQPAVYYVLNLRTGGARPPGMTMLGPTNSKLAPAALAGMKAVSYPARDGLTIHAYLTLPNGVPAGQRVPLIIHPHGGPFGIRDDWGFDPEVQFLASRGYAVLQPNYRGSGGYGLKFLLAGRKEWGGKMQDDLSDGVKWAIAQGIADPARVAIVGASYGGYAALAGVTFTPELYCCAVNYVGVSDLGTITSWANDYGDERTFKHDWIGDDSTYLHDRSPVNFVERIRVPTLHGYGANDPRVTLPNWNRLKAQLDKFGKPYEFAEEGDEGHGFHHENARIAFYKRMDAFLEKNLRTPAGHVEVKPAKVIEMPAGSGAK